jgi:hypothetical protein
VEDLKKHISSIVSSTIFWKRNPEECLAQIKCGLRELECFIISKGLGEQCNIKEVRLLPCGNIVKIVFSIVFYRSAWPEVITDTGYYSTGPSTENEWMLMTVHALHTALTVSINKQNPSICLPRWYEE